MLDLFTDSLNCFGGTKIKCTEFTERIDSTSPCGTKSQSRLLFIA